MEFKKYHSIENSYRENFIDKWVTYNPQLLNEKFILTEKIHGANFSIMITQDEIEYGKRTSKLKFDENFFDWQNTVAKYIREFEIIQEYIKENNINDIRLYGEIFGSNIQKGVFYGKEKRIKVYDCYVEDELMSQIGLINMLKELDVFHMFVPIVAITDTLEEALAFDIKFNSTLIDLEDNICEGVVIKPYEKVYSYDDGRVFYLKYKNKEFSEKQREKKNKVDFKPSDKYEEALHVWHEHLNENRLDSIFSKYGVIEEPKQIGEYIKYMVADAKEDFVKDNKELFLSITDKERGKMFSSSGKVIVPMLQNTM